MVEEPKIAIECLLGEHTGLALRDGRFVGSLASVREGDRFESYVLKEKIAEGGMAEIFRADRVGAMNI
jgi:hypothetical protein